MINKSAADLYLLWEELPEDAQDYILQCLIEENQSKQA